MRNDLECPISVDAALRVAAPGSSAQYALHVYRVKSEVHENVGKGAARI